jgi:hypothetical protein
MGDFLGSIDAWTPCLATLGDSKSTGHIVTDDTLPQLGMMWALLELALMLVGTSFGATLDASWSVGHIVTDHSAPPWDHGGFSGKH